MIIALIAVIVVIILLLIVLGLRALGASSGADDYEDDYDTVEDGVEEERPRRSSRRAPRSRVDDADDFEDDPEEKPAPRSRRRSRAGAEPRASRKPRSRKNRDDDWDDDYFSSLYEDSDDRDDDPDPFDSPSSARRDTRYESTEAMAAVLDEDNAPEEEQPPARERRSHGETAAAGDADSLAVLASLGQESSVAPSANPAPVEALRSEPPAVSPGPRADDDPLSAPRPSPHDSGSHNRSSYDPTSAPAVSPGPRADDDPLSAPRPSPHDSGSHNRSSYDPTGTPTPSRGHSFDTGSHSRGGSYASDPLNSPSYTTGSHSRGGYGSTPSSYDSGSHDRRAYDGLPSAARPAPQDPLTDPSFTPPVPAAPDADSPIWSSLDTGNYPRQSAPPPPNGSVPSGGQPSFRGPVTEQPSFGASRSPAPGGDPGGYGSPYTTGSFGSYDTGSHNHADYPPPTPQGGGYAPSPFGTEAGEPTYDPRPLQEGWDRSAWNGVPSGGQPSFRDPGTEQPSFGASPSPAPGGDPGGYGSPYTTGSFGSYDTGSHNHADYPPPTPQGGPQSPQYPPYPDMLGDYPQPPAPQGGYGEHPGYDPPYGEWLAPGPGLSQGYGGRPDDDPDSYRPR